MKILVLGARSFYGRWFCDVARSKGHDVFGLSRPEFDLLDAVKVQQAADLHYEYVVNFAAINIVADSWPFGSLYYEVNTAGMARVADSFSYPHLEKFVQVSTPEVYGTTGQALKEGAPFNPSTPYAVSRAAADQHLSLMHKEFGFPVCFTRTVNVYGERQQDYRIVPRTLSACYGGPRLKLEGGGRSTRSFIHVEDAARATLRVLEDGAVSETYHVAHPTRITIRSLVEHIAEMFGKTLEDVADEVPERVGKDMAYDLDDSKIRRELDWHEQIDLPGGVHRTMRWFCDREMEFGA
jgi:dTDP-glucose 4,6-dehydratase